MTRHLEKEEGEAFVKNMNKSVHPPKPDTAFLRTLRRER